MGAMKARVVAAREAADEARRELCRCGSTTLHPVIGDNECLVPLPKNVAQGNVVAWDELSGGTDNPMERR